MGSKNIEAPHVEQKPRRTFPDVWNQEMRSAPLIFNMARGTSVLARKCPVHLRHWEQ